MRIWLLIVCAGLAFGQGTEPKPKAEDYESHAQAADLALGAEFMVHSFSRGDISFLAPDYLVVEVALYPAKGTTLAVQNGNFKLRVNGKKPGLDAAVLSMVAASLQHPEWRQPGGIQTSAEGRAGNGGVILGGPPYNPTPFPGSNPPGSQPPPPVKVPRDNPTGIEKEPVRAEDVLRETALPEGEHRFPFSGFLYFPYRGKISGIKTLELSYGDIVLKLR